MLTIGTFIMVYRQTGNRVNPTPQVTIGDKIVKTFKKKLCVFTA